MPITFREVRYRYALTLGCARVQVWSGHQKQPFPIVTLKKDEESGGGAPLPIYPYWKGLGMQCTRALSEVISYISFGYRAPARCPYTTPPLGVGAPTVDPPAGGNGTRRASAIARSGASHSPGLPSPPRPNRPHLLTRPYCMT